MACVSHRRLKVTCGLARKLYCIYIFIKCGWRKVIHVLTQLLEEGKTLHTIAVSVRVNNYEILRFYFLHRGAEAAKLQGDLLPKYNPSNRRFLRPVRARQIRVVKKEPMSRLAIYPARPHCGPPAARHPFGPSVRLAEKLLVNLRFYE
jgi:hypothetical protein